MAKSLMSHERTEKTRIIVAFGDITGFTAYEESVTNDEIEFDPFFDEYDKVTDEMEQNTGFMFTDTGDGFLCAVDLVQGHNCETVIEVLWNLWNLLKRIEELIDKKEPPKPLGFRIRMACGYVHRKTKVNGKVVLRGRHINLAHHMLEVSKETGFIVHDTIKQLLSEKQIERHGFSFTKLTPDRRGYDGISTHHANSLWAFSVSKDRKYRRKSRPSK